MRSRALVALLSRLSGGGRNCRPHPARPRIGCLRSGASSRCIACAIQRLRRVASWRGPDTQVTATLQEPSASCATSSMRWRRWGRSGSAGFSRWTQRNRWTLRRSWFGSDPPGGEVRVGGVVHPDFARSRISLRTADTSIAATGGGVSQHSVLPRPRTPASRAHLVRGADGIEDSVRAATRALRPPARCRQERPR